MFAESLRTCPVILIETFTWTCPDDIAKDYFDSRGARMLTAPERVDTQTLRVRVLRVFDGDGFLTRIWHPHYKREVEVGARLGFIDAPEMEQPGGLEAKQFLENIIGGKWLELSILLKYDTGQIFDRHKRLVCVPYLAADQDTEATTSPLGFLSALLSSFSSGVTMRNVELEMVLNGWAWVVEKYEPDERYMEALADAQKHKRGIWAHSGNVAPWHFKRQRGRAKPSGNNQSELFSPARRDEKCPSAGCGGHLIKRTGKFGEFWGCSEFPKCRYSRSA